MGILSAMNVGSDGLKVHGMRLDLASKNIEPKNAIMVGDRPLTDILAGKLAGAKTILVDSITRETEPKLTRVVRFLERLTIRK